MHTLICPETVMSADQRHETSGTLPKIPAPPYAQYPVLWIKSDVALRERPAFQSSSNS
jgi:hypothetical protein